MRNFAITCIATIAITMAGAVAVKHVRPMPYEPYPPYGAGNLVLATPNGATGYASLRALNSTDIGGPFLPLSGGTITGSLQATAITATSTMSTGNISSTGYGAFNQIRGNRLGVADANSSDTGHTIIAWTSLTATRLWNGTCALGNITNPYFFQLKDESGSASGTITITIQPSSGTIDGAASKTCINSAYGSCRFYSSGTNCYTW